ncbi:hypothetical protein J7413_20095 [Shimia sp. R10_1]|uniref:hypothetical protein n=1 Tax=Shimia sp. R10_1 TaxID=2821095 RepID=UPI001ADA20CB|nr:hypothetical protein [Shimia sp. R10_1]MBO9475842.1 hypothetical protein [Shimia sp. R10_1]
MISHLTDQRVLAGMAVGISISESDQLDALGIDSVTVNHAVRDLVQAILAQGGRVVFGHDWRPGGVMDDIFDFAIRHSGLSISAKVSNPAPVTNYVPWPRQSGLNSIRAKRFANIIRVNVVKPSEAPKATPRSSSSRGVVWNARSLSNMRQVMTQDCHARICLGGKASGYGGAAAGIVEEAYLAMLAGQPLFISAIFGGAAEQFIEQLQGNAPDRPQVFAPDIQKHPSLAGVELQVDPNAIADWGIEKLSQANFLTPDENRQLFAATQISQVIGWVLVGLGRSTREPPDQHAQAAQF